MTANTPRYAYHEWIDKADDDDKSAAILVTEGGPPSTVCFLAQQMAEKLLKSLLEYHEIGLKRSHDLIELAGLLAPKVKDIALLKEDLKLLNGFYIGSRYPADVPEFFKQDAQDALAAAKRVREFVMKKIS